jgi:hypothetical protein
VRIALLTVLFIGFVLGLNLGLYLALSGTERRITALEAERDEAIKEKESLERLTKSYLSL